MNHDSIRLPVGAAALVFSVAYFVSDLIEALGFAGMGAALLAPGPAVRPRLG
jgi:hypothetical protein